MKRVTPAMLRRMPLPQVSGGDDKDSRGCILVVAGSPDVPGAALLAGIAALRAGAGKLQIATARDVAIPLGLEVPEAMVIPLTAKPGVRALLPHIESADAMLIGPGMVPAGMRRFVRDVARRMSSDSTLILDAAAVASAEFAPRGIITPHAGEMAILLEVDREEVEANASEAARIAAERFGCIVALKGETTFIAAGTELYRYDGGDVGLATSGSGDTLAGVVGGLAARGADPLTAALWGVWAHGTAGRRLARKIGRIGFLARELLDEIPQLVGGSSHR
jgi:hydroxyethylthiazole kinase-like uncharacterized protein yjeF